MNKKNEVKLSIFRVPTLNVLSHSEVGKESPPLSHVQICALNSNGAHTGEGQEELHAKKLQTGN